MNKKLHYNVYAIITTEPLDDDNHQDVVSYYSSCGLLETMTFTKVKIEQFNKVCDIIGEV